VRRFAVGKARHGRPQPGNPADGRMGQSFPPDSGPWSYKQPFLFCIGCGTMWENEMPREIDSNGNRLSHVPTAVTSDPDVTHASGRAPKWPPWGMVRPSRTISERPERAPTTVDLPPQNGLSAGRGADASRDWRLGFRPIPNRTCSRFPLWSTPDERDLYDCQRFGGKVRVAPIPFSFRETG